MLIEVPDAIETGAHGINDDGQVVGYFRDALGNHAFVTDGTTYARLAVPGAIDSGAWRINNRGQVVGYFRDASGIHGFLATPVVPDTTPPAITVAASPATLRPPNGRLVAVTVSGTITDEPNGSGVGSAAYQVTDEYGQVQPSGTLTLGADGSYAFTVALPASRKGNDRDGRRYTIGVSATDEAGNEGSLSATVTVPRK